MVNCSKEIVVTKVALRGQGSDKYSMCRAWDRGFGRHCGEKRKKWTRKKKGGIWVGRRVG